MLLSFPFGIMKITWKSKYSRRGLSRSQMSAHHRKQKLKMAKHKLKQTWLCINLVEYEPYSCIFQLDGQQSYIIIANKQSNISKTENERLIYRLFSENILGKLKWYELSQQSWREISLKFRLFGSNILCSSVSLVTIHMINSKWFRWILKFWYSYYFWNIYLGSIC